MTSREWVALEDYARFCETQQDLLHAPKPTDSRLNAEAKRLLPSRFRGTARSILTDAVAPWQRSKAARCADRSPLLLHLGCGPVHKEGWVNVDLVGAPVEIAWNVSRPLPFAEASVDGIFHEHLLEHLPLQLGTRFMRDCWRTLKPGGILRVGVPDAGRLLRSYAGDGDYLESLHPGRPTRLLAAQELFYWHRHLTMFDAETLSYLFRAAGFQTPEERAFGDTRLPRPPDTESRRPETLYVEAER